ncbi:hypothetical protein RUM44_002899 [Polyplax serrata]|uniref:Uncharacterized protein n=1 Tax=Polyplax serrata TaxID=468196 RepID=A0ABR1AX04_POLSC
MSRKIGSSDGIKVKQEGKEDCKEYDAALNARDRLKGALQDLQALHSDNSTDSEDYRVKSSSYKKNDRERGVQRRKKHKVGVIKETPFQHTFVMKLFDRSVDLAQFEENTPLYPICRAWMANNPRSFVSSKVNKEPPKKLKKEDKRESNKKFKLDDILLKDVYTLPPPQPSDIDPLDTAPMASPMKEFELPSESEKNLPTKEVLLASHITHWAEVKKKMRAEAFKREERFEPSKKILKRIFHGAQ